MLGSKRLGTATLFAMSYLQLFLQMRIHRDFLFYRSDKVEPPVSEIQQRQECIPIYLVPFSDDIALMGEQYHFILDGIQKSPFLKHTKNETEGWLWITDQARSSQKVRGDGCKNFILGELRNASIARKKIYGGHLTSNPKTENWTVIHTDWSDGGFHWKCEGMEDYVESVRWAKRQIVGHKKNNITDEHWIMSPGYIVEAAAKAKHIPYAVRTDQVLEITSQLEKEHGIPSFPNETWNLARLDRTHNSLGVCHFWPLNFTEDRGALRAAVSFTIDQLKQNQNITAFVGVSGNPGEEARKYIQEAYVRDLLHCQIVVTTQRDGHEDHYRLMEALASGAMVMTDPMLSLPYGYEDGKNIVIFRNKTDLEQKILFYLKNDTARIAIAERGWSEAMKRHRSWHLAEYLVFGEIRTQGMAVPQLNSCL